MHHIRPEEPRDIPGIRAVNRAAFGSPAEADLVDALREQARPLVSLVADEGGETIGHILFSPVTLTSRPGLLIMGLAPMAVQPLRQRQQIGSALVRAGLDACLTLGAAAVVVLGHPAFYPRFGFSRASTFGLTCEYDAPDEAFMALELTPGALAGTPGRIRYHQAFGSLP